MSLPEFLTWQLALGLFLGGLILGWFLSVTVAAWIVRRRKRRGEWND